MNTNEQRFVAAARRKIARLAAASPLAERERPLQMMEVCGTHTMRIAEYGLKQLLPPQVRLLSGPGCPVCVTPAELVAAALALARLPQVIFCAFGDMLRVPAGADSLLQARAQGAAVRIVLSPLDALQIAREQPKQQVVFFAVGFETTAPLTAATLQLARRQGVGNFHILAAHKTMPQALRLLLGGSPGAGSPGIDALLCPGHVAALTGAAAFRFVATEYHRPAAVAGFQAGEIMAAMLALVRQAASGEARLQNIYPQAVREAGNSQALALLEEVFQPSDAVWRGLGLIPGSGLALTPAYQQFDALAYFQPQFAPVSDHPACRCGAVLRGEQEPPDCPLFGQGCDPEQPQGACMVSSEGACAAYYRYRGVE